jgi:hypothetical protein
LAMAFCMSCTCLSIFWYCGFMDLRLLLVG